MNPTSNLKYVMVPINPIPLGDIKSIHVIGELKIMVIGELQPILRVIKDPWIKIQNAKRELRSKAISKYLTIDDWKFMRWMPIEDQNKYMDSILMMNGVRI